jgi:hypothetical protein
MSYIRAAAPVVAFLLAFATILLILTEPNMSRSQQIQIDELKLHLGDLIDATRDLTHVVAKEQQLRQRLQDQVDALANKKTLWRTSG